MGAKKAEVFLCFPSFSFATAFGSALSAQGQRHQVSSSTLRHDAQQLHLLDALTRFKLLLLEPKRCGLRLPHRRRLAWLGTLGNGTNPKYNSATGWNRFVFETSRIFRFQDFFRCSVFSVGNLWKVESSLGTFSGAKELAKDENTTENNTGHCAFFLCSVRFHF